MPYSRCSFAARSGVVGDDLLGLPVGLLFLVGEEAAVVEQEAGAPSTAVKELCPSVVSATNSSPSSSEPSALAISCAFLRGVLGVSMEMGNGVKVATFGASQSRASPEVFGTAGRFDIVSPFKLAAETGLNPHDS